ncbi:hypothetical protein [Streptomyces iranensis]|uniref:Uncharacterized protein n=1 Tax=Streptomyces iranensis TaxID=576784 RepID=A0A060ZTU7_9ACTN|nr:hypothetical protein [Streptomyces iranensis]MBP2061545.1 hypothetical protein [Streptomyces iranensis]CDR09632.1 predicted protein [Streptomyces iranensis]
MEKRRGDEYRPGMRVRMIDNRNPARQTRDGVIKDRSWGRDRGKPIWWFTVVFDGDDDTEERVYSPGEIVSGIENAQS